MNRIKTILSFLLFIVVAFSACSHAPGTQDVLPFQDKDVTAVDIRYKCFLSESYIAELTQAERIQALLKTLRAQKVISLNASAVEEMCIRDRYRGVFRLCIRCIARDVHQNRAGPTAPGDGEGLAEYLSDVLRPPDQVVRCV